MERIPGYNRGFRTPLVLLMHTTSDSLLFRIRQDDDTAWQRFVDLYTPMMFRWALQIGLPRSEAADLVQEVLVTVFKKLPTFQYDRSRSFRSWLKTVTINRAKDFLRNRATRRELNDHDVDLKTFSKHDDEIEFISTQEYNQMLTRRALDFMQQEFSEAHWKACWLLVVDCKPATEVAVLLDMTPNAVFLAKSRIMRRRRRTEWPS